jgi:hypothetical protein
MEDRISKKGGLVEETVKEDQVIFWVVVIAGVRINRHGAAACMLNRLQSRVPRYLMTETSKHDPEVKDVYVYKFDKHSRLDKCKARLVVWGGSVSQIANL